MYGISRRTYAEKRSPDPLSRCWQDTSQRKKELKSCDSRAFCQTNKLVLLEVQDWATALGGPALNRKLGCIQTNLDQAKDTEFSVRMQLFTNSRELNFNTKNIQEL